jgi:Bacterial archaeo-eukaryotic release factor family 3
MQAFTIRDLRTLLAQRPEPCVSIYLEAGRSSADAPRIALELKNALREIESALASRPEWDKAANGLVDRLGALHARSFAPGHGGTLALFASPGFERAWWVPERITRTVEVAGTFHTRPLVRHLQTRSRFYVLALTKQNVTLYEGSDDDLRIVPVPGMPRGMHELVGHRAARAVSKRTTTAVAGAGGGPVFFGPGGSSDADDAKNDLESFFRMVDRAVIRATQHEPADLVVATFDHHHGMFRELSRNPLLVSERIVGDPEAMTLDDLRERALEVLASRRQGTLMRLADEYGIAVARHRASNDLMNISKAAVAGRVQTLLVEDGRRLAGNLDRTTGEITDLSPKPGAAGPDVLDDVSELVLSAGGKVRFLPQALMPSGAGVSAIYRY